MQAFGQTRAAVHGVPYPEFLAPGLIMMAVLTNACGRNDLLTSLIGTLDAVHSGDMRG